MPVSVLVPVISVTAPPSSSLEFVDFLVSWLIGGANTVRFSCLGFGIFSVSAGGAGSCVLFFFNPTESGGASSDWLLELFVRDAKDSLSTLSFEEELSGGRFT